MKIRYANVLFSMRVCIITYSTLYHAHFTSHPRFYRVSWFSYLWNTVSRIPTEFQS